jgi:NTP pyrophosphatase (non-canonical NTP hydrolase)
VEWSEHNFPGRPAHQPLLGVGEELGELYHAHLKREQGIRGSDAEHAAGIEDAVADIVIFLADFCNAEGIDLEATVERVWDTEVKPRDWRPDTLDKG